MENKQNTTEKLSVYRFSTKTRFILLAMIPLYFMIIGFAIQSPREIYEGLLNIITGTDILITDYFKVGGPGAAFLNAGLLMLFLVALHYFGNIDFDGHAVTSCCMMFGFSLFGKNIFNIWLILAGVFIYSRLHGVSTKKYLYVGCYGTCLSPIITQVMHVGHLADWEQIIISIFTGLSIGYVLLPITLQCRNVHRGYSLYNVGFGAGIIATIVASLFKSFGLEIESTLIWSKDYNHIFAVALPLFFVLMILFSVAVGKKQLFREYLLLIKKSGVMAPDFFEEFSDYTFFFKRFVCYAFCYTFKRRFERSDYRFHFYRGRFFGCR